MKKHLILALALSFTLVNSALADDEEDTTASPTSLGSYGIGGMGGKSGNAKEGAFVIEAQSHGTQETGGTFGQTVYGHGETRLEFGTGFGIAGSEKLGAQLIGARRDDEGGTTFMLHAGIEPWNLSYSFNTDDDREDYLEWMPMASVGAQLAVDSVSAIALLRGGASLGWLGTHSIHASGAYGAGLYLASPDFQLAGEITRTDGPTTVDVFGADARIGFPSNRLSLGVHAEAIVTRDKSETFLADLPGEDDHVEKRLLVTVGGAI